MRARNQQLRGWLGGVVLAIGVALPVAGIGMPDTVRIPIVEEHGDWDPQAAGLFSHWEHNQYMCADCHPSVFPQAPYGFTHEAMDEGRFCAHCHDGERAQTVNDMECEACHVE